MAVEDLSPAGRFIAEARRASLNPGYRPQVDQAMLEDIANDAASRTEFQRLFFKELNDEELMRFIENMLNDLADDLEASARASERIVELIDRAGVAPAVGATVAGIVTMSAILAGAADGVILGPLGLLLGGMAGLAIAGFGRHSLKKRADGAKMAARKVLRLIGK